MKGKDQHVTKRSDGSWQVIGAGNRRAAAVTRTQAEATDIARRISRNQHSELVIHQANGKIRSKDSHGYDPLPPRG